MRILDFRKWILMGLILLLVVPTSTGFALGRGDGESSPEEPSVIKVESSSDFTVALRSDGTVWTWGQNNTGQLGSGDVSDEPRNYPGKVDGLDGVFITDIAAGGAFVLALDSEGRIWEWGCFIPSSSSCGSHPPIASPSIVTVDDSPLIAEEIDAGNAIAMARTASGEVWTWGLVQLAGWGDESAAAGYADISFDPSPVVDASGPLANIAQIAGGFDIALALNEEGAVYVWGTNQNYSLGVPGDSTLTYFAAGELVLPDNAVASGIAASSFSLSSVVVTDQGVYGWSNSSSALGLGYTSVDQPTRLHFLDGLKEIVVGNQRLYGLTHDGGVIRTYEYGTVELPELSGAEKLFAGQDRIFSLASGTVLTAGFNRYAVMDGGSGLTRYTYNLLGNGIMGYEWSYWETPEYEPLPMLAFDALPPAAEVELMQYGKAFEAWIGFPLGRFDKVVVELRDADGVVDTEEKIREGDGWFSDWYTTPKLSQGHYILDVYAADTERNMESHRTSIHFEVKPARQTLYLYGAPDGFDLEIMEVDGFHEAEEPAENVQFTEYEHYIRYEFDGYPELYYRLIANTPGYRIFNDELEVNGDREMIFEASVFSAAEPDVSDYTDIEDGTMYGALYWYHPEIGAEDIAGYKVYFTDAAGDAIDEVIVHYDPDYEQFYLDFYDGFEIPAGSVYLQLFVVNGNGDEIPAHFKKWLEQLQFPEVALIDHDPAVDGFDLELNFDGTAIEDRMTLYKITAGRNIDSVTYDRTVALIPVGQPSYDLHLSELDLFPDETLKFYYVDHYGNTSAAFALLDVTDNMTGQVGMIDYEATYGERFHPSVLPEPGSPSFEDEDPMSGRVAGTVRWTRPESPQSEWNPAYLYDVYYGDGEGNIISGLMRIRQPADSPETVEFRIEGQDLPSGAESLVIVGIRPVGYGIEYDIEWLTIMLEDVIAPSELIRLELGLASGEPIRLEHVAVFVLNQLAAANPVDVTGDGIFDREDVRVLLAELAG